MKLFPETVGIGCETKFTVLEVDILGVAPAALLCFNGYPHLMELGPPRDQPVFKHPKTHHYVSHREPRLAQQHQLRSSGPKSRVMAGMLCLKGTPHTPPEQRSM